MRCVVGENGLFETRWLVLTRQKIKGGWCLLMLCCSGHCRAAGAQSCGGTSALAETESSALLGAPLRADTAGGRQQERSLSLVEGHDDGARPEAAGRGQEGGGRRQPCPGRASHGWLVCEKIPHFSVKEGGRGLCALGDALLPGMVAAMSGQQGQEPREPRCSSAAGLSSTGQHNGGLPHGCPLRMPPRWSRPR